MKKETLANKRELLSEDERSHWLYLHDKALELYKNGKSYKEIADILGVYGVDIRNLLSLNGIN